MLLGRRSPGASLICEKDWVAEVAGHVLLVSLAVPFFKVEDCMYGFAPFFVKCMGVKDGKYTHDMDMYPRQQLPF